MRRGARGWAASARRTLRDFIAPESFAMRSISSAGRSRCLRMESAASSVRGPAAWSRFGEDALEDSLSGLAGASLGACVSESMVLNSWRAGGRIQRHSQDQKQNQDQMRKQEQLQKEDQQQDQLQKQDQLRRTGVSVPHWRRAIFRAPSTGSTTAGTISARGSRRRSSL